MELTGTISVNINFIDITEKQLQILSGFWLQTPGFSAKYVIWENRIIGQKKKVTHANCSAIWKLHSLFTYVLPSKVINLVTKRSVVSLIMQINNFLCIIWEIWFRHMMLKNVLKVPKKSPHLPFCLFSPLENALHFQFLHAKLHQKK